MRIELLDDITPARRLKTRELFRPRASLQWLESLGWLSPVRRRASLIVATWIVAGIAIAPQVAHARGVTDPSEVTGESTSQRKVSAGAAHSALAIVKSAASAASAAAAEQAGEAERERARTLAAPFLSGEFAGSDPILTCLRKHESGGNYQIVSPSGKYRGAYQFSRTTWDATAGRAGRADLVGVLPEQASPVDQDLMATALRNDQGLAPWPVAGRRCADA